MSISNNKSERRKKSSFSWSLGPSVFIIASMLLAGGGFALTSSATTPMTIAFAQEVDNTTTISTPTQQHHCNNYYQRIMSECVIISACLARTSNNNYKHDSDKPDTHECNILWKWLIDSSKYHRYYQLYNQWYCAYFTYDTHCSSKGDHYD